MIGIVTDSTSMLPPTLCDRYGIEVVPMLITIDGVEHREGHDLTNPDFYRMLATGATVTTAAPSPGDVLEAFRRCVSTGADQILAVHTGSNISAVVASARVAAELAEVPVVIVDTELVSFPVALCVWASAEAAASGAGIDAVAAVARSVASASGSVFIVGVPKRARAGGRFAGVSGDLAQTSVIELDSAGMRELERVADVEAALDAMARHTLELARDRPLRIGIGDAARPDVAAELAARLSGGSGIVEVVRYEVGPSVGAHTGAGSVGVVYAPATV